MKKLSVIVSLSLMLSSLSWAEKYEYVRIFGGQEPVTLNSGDIAWWVNYYYSDYIYQFDEVGNEFGGHRWLMSSAVGGVSQISRTFIGPCKLGLRENENINSFVTLKILRVSQSGYKTLEWNGEKYAGTTTTGSSDGSQQANNNSSPVPDPSGIKYDSLLGWVYFTDTPWVYSYTNGSWYYMHSLPDGIYVWNANLPDNGWIKLHG